MTRIVLAPRAARRPGPARAAALAAIVLAGLAGIVGSGGGGTPAPPAHGGEYISLRTPQGQDAAQYYANIGASGDTLAAFKQRNGFNGAGAAEASAVYFNAGDLNLGRDMHCLPNASGLACYVANHARLDGANNAVFEEDPSAAFAAIDGQAPPFATVAMEGGAVIGPATINVRECDGTPTPPRPVDSCGGEVRPTIFEGEIRPVATGLDKDSGIDIAPGDTLEIRATGTIDPGFFLIADRNGPDGWANDDNDPKFPLRGSKPFALVGRIGGGAYFFIGASHDQVYKGPPGRLFLRSNDDTPGNGWGHFDVTVSVRKPVKFFVYNKNGTLEPEAALDTEGAKPVPGVCLACHGGVYDTATHTVSGANFLPFNLKSFKYGSGAGQSRAAQEEQFRRLNAMVHATRPAGLATPDAVAEFIEGMYQPRGVGTPGALSRDDYVPAGWQAKPNLYLRVVRPYCSGCHVALNKPGRLLDLNTSAQLTGNTSLVNAFVCGSRVMPHSEVTYSHFWLDDDGAVPDDLARELGMAPCTR